MISNPQQVPLVGLPDQTSFASASLNGEDWRTIEASGQRVRLLSERVLDDGGAVAGVLQSGIVLELRDRQVNELLITILIASLAGLLGAAVVTLLVTNRALRPIRTAFAAERRFRRLRLARTTYAGCGRSCQCRDSAARGSDQA